MNMYQSDLRNMHDQCKNYLSYHVTLTMTDGRTMDGIIDNVTSDYVSVLVGEDVMDREEGEESDTRYYGGYGIPRRRFRRFRRFDFPLATLAALALLPYIAPPPPPYPYYPYYPYY
ncbi:small nuclear ribonucleoprotein [Alkalihalobacillus deserti]|uniref:small nuclear ribonucleoprotein n=1 Tax=Alkalihalobacillus deserti TaxID=2879466 RepID=UPI001D136813|nr:small nuclear ribonucleoprotein [Alkalihalobacillus deserti]